MALINLPSSIWQFSTQLYQQIHSTTKNDQNIIISPFSINMCLAMTLMGACGTTAKEISDGLRLNKSDNATIAKEYGTIISSLKLNWSLANKIYVMKGFKVNPKFKEIPTKQFMTEIELIDFGKNTEAAITINKWVQHKTNRRIKEIVQKNMFSNLSRLVLVNTVYFKCSWLHQFAKYDTSKQPFFHSKTNSHECDMMEQINDFLYAENKDLDSKVIILKYVDKKLSMVIILPNSRTGLDKLNMKLLTSNLAKIVLQTRSKTRLKLCLPKFRIDFELKLPDTLRNMGMNLMFDDDLADLSRTIENAPGLFVSDVIHKAFIDVTETGTEAGGATVLQDMEFSEPEVANVLFTADHPFRFFIRNEAGVVLFDGCFRNAR